MPRTYTYCSKPLSNSHCKWRITNNGPDLVESRRMWWDVQNWGSAILCSLQASGGLCGSLRIYQKRQGILALRLSINNRIFISSAAVPHSKQMWSYSYILQFAEFMTQGNIQTNRRVIAHLGRCWMCVLMLSTQDWSEGKQRLSSKHTSSRTGTDSSRVEKESSWKCRSVESAVAFPMNSNGHIRRHHWLPMQLDRALVLPASLISPNQQEKLHLQLTLSMQDCRADNIIRIRFITMETWIHHSGGHNRVTWHWHQIATCTKTWQRCWQADAAVAGWV